ncbi:MAG: hypothetical protein JF599_12680 [Verrucomicrobia bacterium]|nr:hypothetical protein [Verrucomicrobiota bacterium]
MRFLLISVVVIVAVLAAVIALTFTPAVQTWALHRVLAGQPGLNASVGSVSAGLHATHVEDVRFSRPGVAFTLPSADVEVTLLDAVRRRVALKQIVAKGWTLDLTAAGASAGSPPPVHPADSARQAFEGFFKQLRLPVDLSLDALELEGDVILPEGRAHVVISGGGLAAGQDGQFTLKAGVTPAKQDGLITALTVHSDILVRMDTPRSLEHIVVTTDATATGAKLPKGANVRVILDAGRATGGAESYSVILRAEDKELASLGVQLPEGAAPLAGTWKLDARDTDLAPFALGRALPVFTATGQGTFSADRVFSEIHAAGQLNATADKLAAIAPEFSAIGRVNFVTDFDLSQQGKEVRIQRLNANVSGDRPVAGIETLQEIVFNLGTRELKAADPAKDLVRISLQGAPLAWARPFLPDIELTGEDVRGEFAAAARKNGFTLRTVAPLTLTQLGVARAGQPLVRSLDVVLSLGADYTPEGWQAEVTDLTASSGGINVFKGNARAGRAAGPGQTLKTTAAFEADLPLLLAQPVAARSGVALTQGVVRGDISASLGEKQGIACTLQLAGLVAASQALPEVDVYVRADRDSAGRIDAQAPIVITQAGRKSDLTLGAVMQPAPAGFKVDAQVKSDLLYLEDLKMFAGLVPPSAAGPAATASPTAKPAQAPSGPVWAGVSGELKLGLKKVVYNAGFQLTDIGGTLKIDPDMLSLEALRAVLGDEGNLKADGSLRYNANVAEPYELKADLAVTGFNPAPLLRSLNSNQPAAVDGKFDLATHLAGRAKEPVDFTESALGDVTLTSRSGTLRALSVKTGKMAETTSTAATLMGIVGALTGSRNAVKYGERGQAASAVIQQLGAIRFDQFNVVVARDTGRNVVIKDLTLISPTVRLAGSGQITYAPGVPLVQRPLHVDLQLGAREQLAENLRTINLIKGDDKDALGYAPMVEPIKLEGSLQAIGNEQLKHLLDLMLAN